ncbi:MAG: HAD family hydrolase [Chloroflexi bacterium]|nr:HAD-IIA family hydrolase [Anaerolineaceae bacterium]NMB89053.1 HAD family hydrolase [Chloroflexota bacterium]
MGVKNYLIDMDGVLVNGNVMIPGADQFIERLKSQGSKFLVLTNNSRYTPRDLSHNLRLVGLDIPPEWIFTSAIATARFLRRQRPNSTAFVIGDSGLTAAIHDVGYIITEYNPEYVVLGETTSYTLDVLTKAIRLILNGSRFIATNPDPSGPSDQGVVPGCGAVAAMIQSATGKAPFFIGKPSPLMMRTALNYLQVHSEDTIMVGDRMETDMAAGVQSGMETILVLSGMTRREDVDRYPYVPTHICNSVADIE